MAAWTPAEFAHLVAETISRHTISDLSSDLTLGQLGLVAPNVQPHILVHGTTASTMIPNTDLPADMTVGQVGELCRVHGVYLTLYLAGNLAIRVSPNWAKRISLVLPPDGALSLFVRTPEAREHIARDLGVTNGHGPNPLCYQIPSSVWEAWRSVADVYRSATLYRFDDTV